MNARSVTLLASLLAGGCGSNPYFSDDEGAPRAGDPTFGEHPDELSLPYALGTEVGISVKGVSNTGRWTVVSDQPALFAVESSKVDNNELTVKCRALAEGEARLRLFDDHGQEQRRAQVSVSAPDRARAYAHGTLRIYGRNQSALTSAELTQATVLVGGKAAFALAYFRGSERVYGRGIAEFDAPPALTVEGQTTEGVATNEWMFVTPTAPGPYALNIKQGAATLLTLPIATASESDLVGVSLAEEHHGDVSDGTEVWLLAQAHDAAGNDVLGVYDDWTLDGAAQQNKDKKPATGDLYRYTFGKSRPLRTVTAAHGAMNASATVHAQSGYIADTTYLGCAFAPGRAAPRGTLAALVLFCGVFFLVRRRR
jgi:hypothetical protein